MLAAYLQWGLDAAAHLAGEFAWCLWDGRERRLVCARDHFGIRPLYYAAGPRALAVSNAVTSLQRAGTVSDRLLDRAVGDLLVFGDPQEPADTMLADVRRVPPAHALTWTRSSGVEVWAYWRLTPPPPLRVRRARDVARAVSRHAAARRGRSHRERAGHGVDERRAGLDESGRAGGSEVPRPFAR